MKALKGKIENLSTKPAGTNIYGGRVYEHTFTCSGIRIEFSLLSSNRLTSSNFKNGDYCILLGEYKNDRKFVANIVAPIGGGSVLRWFKRKEKFCILSGTAFSIFAISILLFDLEAKEKHILFFSFLSLAVMFFWLYRYYTEFVRLLREA